MPTTEREAERIRQYEAGYRDGHKIGYAAGFLAAAREAPCSQCDCTEGHEAGCPQEPEVI